MNTVKLRNMLEAFFIEDIGDSDVTTDNLFQEDDLGILKFLAKDTGVFCGREVILEGFRTIDQEVAIEFVSHDGVRVQPGDVLALVKGPVRSLLKGERVILNLIQRMSAIATKTRQAVSLIEGTRTKICDTRKTTPGLRMLEKYAVRCGGGFNHRMGLHDTVMLKDNHIDFTGSISEAVKLIKSKIGHTVKIEVEIETKEQLMEAITAGVDIIMFDNRTPEEIHEWLSLVPPHIATEASGGIKFPRLREYALTGIDVISLGCLTHSIEAFDISAKVEMKNIMMEEVK
ncbi:carboxylating nicotinate-nucleotide diphosphorylase [Falsibacillus albus]|uniref:Probable nicotinate-nucleotide pyrophosphorylase [carboxylating] n=1 Tax=Falsibacillus albus TaxID=2478915 RepID=A0A3L7K4W4_9BACI|nr:carboxylating nicotinate-nucleotide diphosphorylase [Falsibacillus albus]RLQ98077.1 carboxylating nicotinate-nucleotide diphosphorylase [Falsibacillus albus]